jgi:hypothetical protein
VIEELGPAAQELLARILQDPDVVSSYEAGIEVLQDFDADTFNAIARQVNVDVRVNAEEKERIRELLSRKAATLRGRER